MKKFLKITCMFGIMVILLISSAFAEGINIEVNDEEINAILSDKIELLNDEVINTDLTLINDNINVDNDVNGNIYMIGEIVNISSKNVDGDIFIVANDVTINTNVNGNVYVFTNNLNISGNMKDIYVFAENVNFNKDTTCRDLKTFATSINVDGIVNRDLYAATGDIKLSETGKVSGILSSTNELIENKENVNETIIIEDITKNIEVSEDKFETFVKTAAQGINLFLFISAEVTGLMIILLIVLFTSNKSINKSELKEYGLMDTVYGLLYFVLAILIIIGLMLTLVGIPVAILLSIILWFISWKITIPVASIQLAKGILKPENRRKAFIWIIAFLIFTIVQSSKFIPGLGGLIKLFVSLYGFGYMIRSLIRKNKTEDSKQEIIENV